MSMSRKYDPYDGYCILQGKNSPPVRPSVMLSSKSMKNGLLWILNDLDSAGRGGRRDEEEGGTRRKEGRGGRRNEEEGGTRRVKK